MILNANLSSYAIWFPQNFFYPEIEKEWLPVIKRLKLPYQTLEDFINANVQSLNFPRIDLTPVTQQQSEYLITYRGGKEIEPLLDKNLTVTFKMSEGLLTYWILFNQIELYLKYEDTQPFWPSLFTSFIDNNGFEILNFEFQKTVPIGLSAFDVSYSKNDAAFQTFTLNLRYNRFKITYKK
jgi:hypothetical protein